MSNSDSVPVKGSELRFHRKKKFPSAQAFAAACESVSVPTVYRAERGGPIMRAYLRRMERELGLPEDSLVTTEARQSGTATMTGTWVGLQTATDRLGKSYIFSEEADLQQRGTRVDGRSVHKSSTGVRNDRFVDCVFNDGVFTGSILSEDWPKPLECPVFVLSCRRSLDWLQGYLTWFDLDSEQAEVSKYFLIRREAPDFEQNLADAQRMMEGEVDLLRLRKLQEAGVQLRSVDRLSSLLT